MTTKDLEIKKRESKRYHAEQKGCKIVPKKIRGSLQTSGAPNYIYCAYCETHQRLICHCGWEWGWHYGTKVKLKRIKRGRTMLESFYIEQRANKYAKNHESSSLLSGESQKSNKCRGGNMPTAWG